MSCAPTSAGITAPLLSYGPTQSPSVSQYFTTQNAHYALTACGFEQTVIGAICGVADGLLYASEGDWTGAGLSAGSVIPAIGLTADITKAFRVAAAAVRSALLGAKSIPEFLSIADARKIVDASAGNVKVLHGTADDGKAVFEAQTKGWVKVQKQTDKGQITETIDPTGRYTFSFREFSTSPARGSVSKINGTIDIIERDLVTGQNVAKWEVKFAE
jgi:hypothetical protein